MQILLDQIHCFCSLSSIALLSNSRTQMRLVLYEAAMKSSGITNTVLLVQFCPTEIINKQAWHQAPRGKTIQQKKWYKILVWEYTIPATTTVTAAATTTCKSPCYVYYTHLISLVHHSFLRCLLLYYLHFTNEHTEATRGPHLPTLHGCWRVRRIPLQARSSDWPLDELGSWMQIPSQLRSSWLSESHFWAVLEAESVRRSLRSRFQFWVRLSNNKDSLDSEIRGICSQLLALDELV